MGAVHGARYDGCSNVYAVMESMVLLLLFLFPLLLLLLLQRWQLLRSRVSSLLSGGSVELLWFVV